MSRIVSFTCSIALVSDGNSNLELIGNDSHNNHRYYSRINGQARFKGIKASENRKTNATRDIKRLSSIARQNYG